MNSVYLSLIKPCMQSLSRSFSVSIVIWFPLCNVRNKCECAHTMRVGMVLVVRPYVHHIIYSDKHTSVCEEIKISPPNLSEGGSLRSSISVIIFTSVYSDKNRLKKLTKMKMMIIIIMKKSQETTVFSGHQKLTFAMKLRPEK